VYRKSKARKALLVTYSLPDPEDFKKAERLAAVRKDKNNWKYLFEGPPELTNIPGYVWVKSKEGGRLVEASEVPAHEITFRCKAELRPHILPPIFLGAVLVRNKPILFELYLGYSKRTGV
jgi:hypothetical protein